MKAFWIDFFREIKKNMGRFVSVFFIVMLGAAFFSGIRSARFSMEYSADVYYDNSDLMDIRVLSTLGLSEEDIADIGTTEGVKEAAGGYTKEVLCNVGDSELVLKLIADTDGFNRPFIKEGRLPQISRECFVDEEFLKWTGCRVGDMVTFRSGDKEELQDSLITETYEIVGSGSLPYYMALGRGTGSIGDGSIDCFVLLSQDAFKMDIYTEAYVHVEGAKEKESYSTAYSKKVDKVTKRLEDYSETACKRRYDSIYAEGKKELEDAEKKLTEALHELADAKEKIEDGEQKLADAKKTLEEKETDLQDAEKKLVSEEKRIADAKAELAQKKKELESARKDLEKGKAAYEKGKKSYAQGRKEYEEGEQQQKEANEQLSKLREQIEQLEAAYLPEELAQSEDYQMMVQQKAVMEAATAEGEKTLNAAKESLEEAKKGFAEYEKGAAAVAEGEAQLASGEAQLSEGEDKLTQARKELENGEKQLSDGKKELKDKEEELKDARKEYETAYEDAQPELADAREKIADGKEVLSDLKIPEWYVLDRDMIESVKTFGDDAGRIANIGRLFPVIFFLVAALVSLTAMTRMVEEQRQQIGTLKALGYGNGIITLKYFSFAMLSTLTGAIAGVLVGEKLLPWVIMEAYGMMYQGLPEYLTPFNLEQGALAIAASAACTGVATLAACLKELRAKPSELMRPEPPKNGKRVFLERVTFIWKHLSFTKKSTVRNLIRYKKRFFMTVIGIGGCMALMLVGYGLEDSIKAIAKYQYVQLFTYKAEAAFNLDAKQEEKDSVTREISETKGMEKVMELYSQTVDIQSGKEVRSAVLEVPGDLEAVTEFFTFRDRKTQEIFDFPTDGAIISEKTAKLLNISVGDTIHIKKGDTNKAAVKISRIMENYVMHYLFITPELYESLYGKMPEYNHLLMNYTEEVEKEEEALGKKLLAHDVVTGVSFISSMEDSIDNMLESLNIVIWVLIVSAGLLAFVVLYNLNSINITERQRELATIKVLGFYDKEVASYVYRENVLLTLIGIVAGMGMGVFLHQYVIQSVEVEAMMFGRNIFPRSFVISGILTICFSLFVNLIMYFKLKKINMIESLKSVE